MLNERHYALGRELDTSRDVNSFTKRFLKRRAVGDVTQLARATHDWATHASRSLGESYNFHKWWEALVYFNSFWDDGRFVEYPEVRYPQFEQAFVEMSESLSLSKLSTDLLDKETILATIVSNVKQLLESKGDATRSEASAMGRPLADAFDKVLFNESKDHRVKKSLILEYLNLMREPGFPRKSVDAVLRFSQHVDRQLEDPLVKILAKNRGMMDLR